MGCDNIKWLHSNGPTNKEPSHDLGNFPSEFEIAQVPMNNLFDDVSPEESSEGLTDYRCFYICNTHINETIEDVIVTLTPMQESGGSEVEIGSVLQNDIQQIFIEGSPDSGGTGGGPASGGYVIFQAEFGPPFTVHYDATGFCGFMADFETKIKMIDPGIVVTDAGGGTCNPFNVEFGGSLKNRKVKLIKVVQNDLLIKDWGTYKTASYSGGNANGVGDKFIRVTRPINFAYVLASGTLYAYNPEADGGTFVPLEYIKITSDTDTPPYDLFELLNPLPFSLPGRYGPDSPVFPSGIESPLPAGYGTIEVPLIDNTALVHICKQQDGSPINCIATPVANDTTEPENATFTTTSLEIGTLYPQECFFLWAKRDTAPGTGPFLQDNFSLTFKGMAVNWP